MKIRSVKIRSTSSERASRSTPLRRRTGRLLACAAFVAAAMVGNIAGPAAAVSGDVRTHDPSVIVSGNCYWAFSTGLGGGPGGGTPQIRKSCGTGGKSGWTFVGTVFNSVPSWVTKALGSTPPNLWAPDINYVNGKYYLYYAGAIWDQSGAVLGLATASSLSGPWSDQGEVTQDHSPIDPNLGWSGSTPYLFAGGFSGGYVWKAVASTGKTTGDPVYISKNIENQSLVYNGGYYYLFGSKGRCCAGASSTYYSVVSRSTSITGPYKDESGVAMTSGGGTRILDAGGGDVFQDGSSYKFAYHYYDPNNNYLEHLDIRPITFSGGWPVMGNPIGN